MGAAESRRALKSFRRTRYAPSPTGPLHLGHVAHMLYVWGAARAFDAEVILRMEDHDRGRSRTEFERDILADIEWLGFRAANTVAPVSAYRQSDCGERYRQALARLNTYRCGCSRKEIAARVDPNPDGERPYDGFCRQRGLDEGGVRVELEAGEESFVDGLLGEQSQDPSRQCGDLLLRDRNNDWTYQFAVVVDDLCHEVDLVVRGEDLLASTGRQIRLAKMLGGVECTQYVHHPLILDESGVKLSKSTGSLAVAEMCARGMSAEQVLTEAASRVGLSASREERTLDELIQTAARSVAE